MLTVAITYFTEFLPFQTIGLTNCLKFNERALFA